MPAVPSERKVIQMDLGCHAAGKFARDSSKKLWIGYVVACELAEVENGMQTCAFSWNLAT